MAESASQVRVPGGRVSVRHVPGRTGKARPGRRVVGAPSLPVMGGAGPRALVHEDSPGVWAGRKPLAVFVTAGQRGDSRSSRRSRTLSGFPAGPGRPRGRRERVWAGKPYPWGADRAWLRLPRSRCTIPEPADQARLQPHTPRIVDLLAAARRRSGAEDIRPGTQSNEGSAISSATARRPPAGSSPTRAAGSTRTAGLGWAYRCDVRP